MEVRECADKLQAMSRHGGGLVLASALAYNYYSGTQNIKLDGRERGGFRGRGCKALIHKFCERRRPYVPPKDPYSDSCRPLLYLRDYRGEPNCLKFSFEQELPH